MADPSSMVPYHDPYEENSSEFDYLSFIADPSSPVLPVLSSVNEPQLQPQFQPVPLPLPEPSSVPYLPNDYHNNTVNFNNNIADPNDPFIDPMLWDICNGPNNDHSQEAGPSQNRGQTSYQRYEEILNDGRPIPIWPMPPVPFGCSCCQVLREIIHTDGNYTTKLEIHGRLGMICHAILENRDHVKSVPSDPQYHLFDFCKKSIENVKQFLEQYCEERKKAGYLMVHDPLSIFYAAVCVGLEWVENLNNDDFCDPSPTTSGERQMDQTEVEAETERMPKSNLAQQRERAGKLTLKDFEGYFHLPIEEAARRMNLCPTVVKKICRKHGMNRWPHRKVKSIQRQISNLRDVLNSIDAEERARAQAEIQRLEEEMASICAGGTR